MNSSRRKFIKSSALITAFGSLPFILKAGASANEKIVIGLVGCGAMGFANLKTFLKQANIECAAICDVDRNVLEVCAIEVEKIQGKKPILYNDFRELLDNKDIDAVIDGTPDHWHALIGIYAMESGKHLYTEKPLARSIGEGELMLAAQKRYDKIVQVGQWQRSEAHWKNALDYLQQGKGGKILSVRAWSHEKEQKPVSVLPDSHVPFGVNYDMWLGPAPFRPFNRNRFHSTFPWYWDYGGGKITNKGLDLLDFALCVLKKQAPESAMATGGNFDYANDVFETPDTCMLVYDFGKTRLIWDHSCGANKTNFNREHGIAFICERETVIFNNRSWEIIPDSLAVYGVKDYQPDLYFRATGSGLERHIKNFTDCIRLGAKPNCTIETAANAARLCHIGNISYRLGRKVFWNNNELKFLEDDEANVLAKASYRSPWKIPIV